MFYEDEYEIPTLAIGAGDTLIAPGTMLNDSSLGSISFIDNCGKNFEVGAYHNFFTEQKDDELNTVFRLIFSNKESVDVLIERLEKVKEYME